MPFWLTTTGRAQAWTMLSTSPACWLQGSSIDQCKWKDWTTLSVLLGCPCRFEPMSEKAGRSKLGAHLITKIILSLYFLYFFENTKAGLINIGTQTIINNEAFWLQRTKDQGQKFVGADMETRTRDSFSCCCKLPGKEKQNSAQRS